MTCGRSPPQASHRWRPGGFERFPGLLCLGVPLSLREWFSAWHGREIPHQKTWDRSVCRRWRQAAPRLRLKRRQKTKENLKSPTRPPAVKPRVSPESRAFQSPSTASNVVQQETIADRRITGSIEVYLRISLRTSVTFDSFQQTQQIVDSRDRQGITVVG